MILKHILLFYIIYALWRNSTNHQTNYPIATTFAINCSPPPEPKTPPIIYRNLPDLTISPIIYQHLPKPTIPQITSDKIAATINSQLATESQPLTELSFNLPVLDFVIPNLNSQLATESQPLTVPNFELPALDFVIPNLYLHKPNKNRN